VKSYVRNTINLSWDKSLLTSVINKLNEYLVCLLVFHAYFYQVFQFLKDSLHDVFISHSALKGSIPFFFNIFPEHNHALVQPQQEFKNFTVIKICLLHSKPFINNHFHFHIIVECATSVVLLQQPKKYSE
jgi:hypothetical protein